jgi:hypothetical protein
VRDDTPTTASASPPPTAPPAPERTEACVPAATVPALAPTETSVADYRACVRAGACTRPGRQRDKHRDLPITMVTIDQARAYCAWAGSRLPTDAELAAAMHADCEPPPHPNCIRSEAGYSLRRVRPRDGNQIRGLSDLWGNAMEWTEDGTVRGARFCGGDPIETPPAGPSPTVGFRCMAAP